MKAISVLMLTAVVLSSCSREKEVISERSVIDQRDIPASQTNDVSTTPEFALLASATVFGFGVPEGAQEPRSTDVAFDSLMSSPDARQIFIRLFECDNVYAKLYALTALQQLDRDTYNVLATKVNRSQTIHSAEGCVIDEPTVGDILELYERGGDRP